MELSDDLAEEAVAAALAERPLRVYPALLSTEADALAWARAGAPDGALVVAGYQASPRGRAGLEWRLAPDRGLAFSLVLRPRLPAHREGWLYAVAVSALADVLPDGATIEWPDEVRAGGQRAGAVGVQTEIGSGGVAWAVLNVLLEDAQPPRAPLLARVVDAVDARRRAPTARVLADYLRRCETLGRRVRARMLPLGPGGLELEGTAVSVLADGALVLEAEADRRLAVRPQSLGLLEDAP